MDDTSKADAYSPSIVIKHRFEDVRKQERDRIGKHRCNRGQEQLEDTYIGLALSGGGVRSAAFSMGCMAALKDFGVIDRVDYVSSVSGGGFAATALTWFESQRDAFMDAKPNQPSAVGTLAPGHHLDALLGSRHQGQRTDQKWTDPGDYIRLHGDYLRPMIRLGSISVVAVLARNVLLSLAMSLALLSLILLLPSFVVKPLQLIPQFFGFESVMPGGALGLLVAWATLSGLAWMIFLGVAVFYGMLCWRTSQLEMRSEATLVSDLYTVRIRFQIHFARMLAIAVVFSAATIALWLGEAVVMRFFETQKVPAIATVILLPLLANMLGAIKFLSDEGERVLGIGIDIRAMAWSVLIIVSTAILAGTVALAAHESSVLLGFIGACIIAILVGYFVDANYSGTHRMYRDRLMEAFMPSILACSHSRWWPNKEGDRFTLAEACAETSHGPFHILNANVVLVNSADPTFRGRGGDNFVMSPLYCGGDSIDWHSTTSFPFCHLTLASAMAISGSALNPNTAVAGRGMTRGRLLSSVLAFSNIRLGYWLRNPQPQKVPPRSPEEASALDRFVSTLLRATFRRPTLLPIALWQAIPQLGYEVDDHLLELTDGGHFDNSGMYELMRRRVELVIAVDAGADPDTRFTDLANALGRIRIDFGIQVRFHKKYGLEDLCRGTDGSTGTLWDQLRPAKRAFALARIDYPPTATEPAMSGTLVIIKPTILRGLPLEILSFALSRAQFPNTNTADQFFDESKFDAYRQLGYYLAKHTLIELFRIGELSNRHTAHRRPSELGGRAWPYEADEMPH